MQFKLKRYRDNFDYGLFGRPITDILTDGFFNSLDSNITENKKGYRLEVAVPGMSEQNLAIRIEGDTLTVVGKSSQKRVKRGLSNMTEFNSQQFSRSFTLPPNADIDRIKSKCRNGLLMIDIPKTSAFDDHRHIMIEDAEFEELNTTNTLPEKINRGISNIKTKLKNKLMDWMLK